ncbi:tRNA (adenosine(37)-N6)-threonylcarbamoyltransferase complex dimerization subunit type 1 TsaB [Gillisia limnaea]|uniref:Universal protein YeaZ n=1 Tax=Gillisia limnaea (strain DSM 15749 / LMG 21470 / R-8282) TaxID=865937 RepID=H2BYI8_GILLR|nr:tRNA (adenosine(37)-N6)-threonylcarbamoyltransferase complex dimerization subunit type 1 TsaB [Gillisia limnaea]EHQ03327.1 universal protein YeaZ [Gillisia limnaea DSM 15749]
MNILCIETASTNCSVALAKNGKLLALKEDYNNGFSHAERLHIFIRDILAENDMQLSTLDAIAVSKGPGSYTGLRIGVSAAKGLCFSLGIPLISVSTLTALAYQVKEKALVITMLDARRMEVYSAVFDKERKQVQDTSAKILDETSYLDNLENGPVYFIGSGVTKFKEICRHPNANFIEGKLPSANQMVQLAISKYKISDFEDVAYFEPYYLKDFMAG